MDSRVLAGTLLAAGTVEAVFECVVHAARDRVPRADLVSVAVREPSGRYRTPVATEPLATALDRLQYRAGEGACVAVGCAAVVASDDLATDPRWPYFGPVAAALGVRSVTSAALLPDGANPPLFGSLNVYSRGRLTEADRTALRLLTTHASLALARVRATTKQAARLEQLRRALVSRDLIGQAKGILMARRGLTEAEAFDLLRRTSQKLNVKLRELATALVSQ